MSRHALIETLAAALAHQAAGALAVGVSGGMDSTVLLHALAQLPGARARGLRAIHVDHGIHADSARWARHCQSAAHGLGLECCVIAVQVVCADTGLEDAARRVRYAALAEELREGEILVLAHHRDDQAETILLKLLRGAGPEGLGGMRAQRALGRGKLWRPLLDLPRSALAGYAEEHGLAWIEDPSNADTRLRRNFLRRRVLPLVTERWPEATAALAHSARWARDAAEFIDRESATALAALRRAQATALDWRGWLTLAPALRDPVLRRWLRELGADEPGHQHVAELERQLRDAGGDRAPCVRFATTELRRYR
ncbi:MAG TPA: tRNA lysidine(34) synthetase TilS, partial [Rudaea sp.]|nr:tRNA lysidine(34) synthetase TilS [Rudaea sp.]